MGKLNLLVADSNQLSRCGLNAVFGQFDDVQLVGEATHSDQLSELLQAFSPDVLLIDYTSAGFSIDDVHRASAEQQKMKVVAITPEQSGPILISALKAGVCGYVKKDCDLTEISDAVFSVHEGNRFFCGKILETIRKEGIDTEELNIANFSCEPVSISDRENEIIKLIAEGYTNSRIAERLFISAHTVNTHRKNIMQKLGVNNTAAVVLYAVKTGLVSPNKFLFAPSEMA